MRRPYAHGCFELERVYVKDTSKASVRQIAQQLGLSAATVSLALNGRRPTGFVSADTRKQVWKTAKELGYSLDRLRARRPLLERVAVFMHSGPNPFSETVLEFCRTLNQHRVQVLTHLTRSDRDAEVIAADLYRRHEIDAAVFIGSRAELPSLELPLVFVGEVPVGSRVWQVRADNEGAARSVGEHLWALGHRAVAMIVFNQTHLAGERRMEGFRAFWNELGVLDLRVLRVDMDAPPDAELQTALGTLLSEVSPVTALFCFNDWIAGTALQVLRRLKVRVPEEMSVVGFDDSVYAPLLDPPLTTVHHPFGTMGRLAAELLLEQVEHPDAEPRVLVAPCHLVGRQSSTVP